MQPSGFGDFSAPLATTTYHYDKPRQELHPNFNRHLAEFVVDNLKESVERLWLDSEYRILAQQILGLGIDFSKPESMLEKLGLSEEAGEQLGSQLELQMEGIGYHFEQKYACLKLSEKEFFEFLLQEVHSKIFPLLRLHIERVDPVNVVKTHEVSRDVFIDTVFGDKGIGVMSPFTGHFYKIKKDGITKGYLLGTVHQCEGTLFKLSKSMNKAIAKSKRLFLEIKNPFKSFAQQIEAKIKLVQDKGEEATCQTLSNFERELSTMSDSGWETFKDKHCYNSLASDIKLRLCFKHYHFLIAKKLGSFEDGMAIPGIDCLLHQRFTSLGKEVHGFEKMRDLPLEDQLQALSVPLTFHVNEEIAMCKALSKDWLVGKKITVDATKEEDPHLFHLTVERSQKFLEIILADLKEGRSRAIYGIGLGHFYDKADMLKTLEEEQYIVIRK